MSEFSPIAESTVREIHQELVNEYGKPGDPPENHPVESIVRTIISQNSTGTKTKEAYENLISLYGDLAGVHQATEEEIADAISVSGLPGRKASYIQNALDAIYGYEGGYSGSFLKNMEQEEVIDWLTDISGIGLKTASVVASFSCGQPVCAVDTHVHRVSRRMGMAPPEASRKKVHRWLNDKEVLPEELRYDFHVLFIRHGRTHCTARNPTCDETSLGKYCEH